MDPFIRYTRWLESEYTERETKLELESIKDDPEEIRDRFYRELEFGTAGLRGKLGAGDNRMNTYNVARVTQGLANFIISKGVFACNRGVVIARDSRHKSREFAETAASVLAANGIKVFLFDDIRPTPELSYAIIELSAISGIMITASHNPKDYNGYKLYWEDGAQVLPEIADSIYSKIQLVDLFGGARRISFEEALGENLIESIGKAIDDSYISKVKSLSLRDSPDELDKNIRIVYTPLNGTGNVLVKRVFRERGFNNLFVVPEQEAPDPDFSTVEYPNPEDPRAFRLAIEYGHSVNADILMATDPDADRLAVMVRDGGNYVFLNGNQTGALLVYYILLSMKEKERMPENGFIVKSIVTGDMAKVIASDFGVKTYESLTGFKNICGKALQIESEGEGNFIFGYEESIGYVTGNFVRDKDAISSSMLVGEMAAYFRRRNLSLLDVLNHLFDKYGVFSEKQISLVLEGVIGQERIGRIMKELRERHPRLVGDLSLSAYTDYLSGETKTSENTTNFETGIPKSDVIKFLFDDGSWYAIRPSGTEPKLKIYIYSRGSEAEKTENKVSTFEREILSIVNSIE
jgi:phosphoglucomutase